MPAYKRFTIFRHVKTFSCLFFGVILAAASDDAATCVLAAAGVSAAAGFLDAAGVDAFAGFTNRYFFWLCCRY